MVMSRLSYGLLALRLLWLAVTGLALKHKLLVPNVKFIAQTSIKLHQAEEI